jgi:hypothetical protein
MGLVARVGVGREARFTVRLRVRGLLARVDATGLALGAPEGRRLDDVDGRVVFRVRGAVGRVERVPFVLAWRRVTGRRELLRLAMGFSSRA